MPYASSNIPIRIFYSCFEAETIRIAKVNTNSNGFIETTNTLIEQFQRQGASNNKLKQSLDKVYGRNQSVFLSFAIYSQILSNHLKLQ